MSILATGGYWPDRVVVNDEICEAAGVTAEWIRERTGIRERRWAKPDQATSDLAAMAGRAALAAAGLSAVDLSLIIVATSTPDSPQPPTACVVADELGAGTGAAAFDINAVCSGFVFALSVAERMLAGSDSMYVLVIGADMYSRILNPADRRTVVLFGDGAGAVVLGPARGRRRLVASRLITFGSERDLIKVRAGGSRLPASADTVELGLHYFTMNGRAVRDFVAEHVPAAIRAFLSDQGLSVADIAHFVPHQANGRMLADLARRVGIPDRRMGTTYEDLGNTGAASVPITLHHLAQSGALGSGDLVLLAGFGGGMSLGLGLLRW
ncbi:3-oxoacyl-ACP synthase III family protein [Sphaerimonospora thailandensis]|uniref:3-oxoacyl-[acyl-carrier-protein] synthase 3 n=1 Tax=Sphaerimonospora thailandensis TaxID=795644 RepID=A0A8J3R5Q9_9ACTN|nr:ketoacyl-ACP synthase III [Sphaerimonospora thailandensis]GIH67989.1 3-oxoacyl-[acyl-carrier-protein] synthase 3 [Sphaerimonospora thailandensis]